MNEYQVDQFLTSILGGFVGSGIMIAAMYGYFKSLYRRYWMSRDAVNKAIALNKLEADVAKLQIQVSALHGEFYHAVTEDAYK